MRRTLILALALTAVHAAAQTNFSNGTDVRLPGSGTGGTTTGSAGMYPIDIVVSGMGGITTDVDVTFEFGTLVGTTSYLLGEEHTWFDDLDIMLVAPDGTSLLVSSDAGGGNDANGTYTFDDEAAAAIADGGTGQNTGGNLNNGSYRVSQYGTGDIFLAPAPAPSYTNTALSAFDGGNPNGTWQLWIMDDAAGDVGWLMNTTLTITAVPEPATLAVLGIGVIPFLRRRKK